MVDTPRTQTAIVATTPDNTIGLFTNQNLRDLIISGLIGTPQTVAAAGSTAGTATALGSFNVSVITSGTLDQGVALAGVTTFLQIILNASASEKLVYPFTGAAITGGGTVLGANVGFAIAAGSWAGFVATDSTHHYAFYSPFV